MEIVEQAPRRRPGRPLSFDRTAALHQAMLLFWKNGYETTSVAELTEAMGITAPSLYTAFGDKRCLFLEAVTHYQEKDTVTALSLIGEAPNAREAARQLLLGSAIAFTGIDTPRGCLLASAGATGSSAAVEIQAALASVRRQIETALRKKAARDLLSGDLFPGTDVAALAAFTVATIQGMSVAARDGASRKKLELIAKVALSAWFLPPGEPLHLALNGPSSLPAVSGSDPKEKEFL